MPGKISSEKESEIVRLYLQGSPQIEIAERVEVSQSTVSQATSRFKKDASDTSLEAAAASRGVSQEN